MFISPSIACFSLGEPFLHLLRCKAPGLKHQDHFGLFKAVAVNGIAPRIDRSDAKTSKASSWLSTRSCLWQVRICRDFVRLGNPWKLKKLITEKKRNIQRYQAQATLFYAMPPTRTITRHVQVSYVMCHRAKYGLRYIRIRRETLHFLTAKIIRVSLKLHEPPTTTWRSLEATCSPGAFENCSTHQKVAKSIFPS